MPNFQRFIDVLADALHILDFSHLISGVATFLIITLTLHLHNIHLEMINYTWTIICSLMLVYIAGVLSWMVGKEIRNKLQNKTNDFECIMKSLVNVNAENNLTKIVLPDNVKFLDLSAIYTYMWVELAKCAPERVSFINRFWVIQAMCEGLMTSCIVAIIASVELFCSFPTCFDVMYFIALIASFVLLFCTCMLTAQHNARTQVREVVMGYFSYCLNC